MNWQQKMDLVIKTIFSEYAVDVVSESEFNIWHFGDRIMNVKTIDSLQSHWRMHIRKAILKIIDDKVSEVLNKY